MRMQLVALIAALFTGAPAMAQAQEPSEIGNRANGFSYQPTPDEVAPRERAAGIQPSTAHEQAVNRDLEHMDQDLMREEGLSTQSVPKLTSDQ
jgi:hypothetical protein